MYPRMDSIVMTPPGPLASGGRAPEPVEAPVVGGRRGRPARQQPAGRLVHFDGERPAGRQRIAPLRTEDLGGNIAARAGGEGAEQVHFGEELEEVPGFCRARLREVPAVDRKSTRLNSSH